MRITKRKNGSLNGGKTSQKYVAVIVLTWNGRKHLRRCFDSLQNQTYRNYRLYFYDQASDDGSLEFVRREYPGIVTYQFPTRGGYAEGNNAALKKCFEAGADLCLLINDDTESDTHMIEELVLSYERAGKSMKVGLVQPTVLLFDRRDSINSEGNAIHYLGFGYCKDFMKAYVARIEDMSIASASGAALLVSKEFYRDVGGFDEDFFMYNEDENYSWRGLLKGYVHMLSARSIVYHKYNFGRHAFKIYHSEKNRLMILLENYSALTLFLLFPMIAFNELIAVAYALISGYILKKLASYQYVLSHAPHILRKRQAIQSTRLVSDKLVMKRFESELLFEEMKNPLLRKIINPIFKAYYWLLLKIMPR